MTCNTEPVLKRAVPLLTNSHPASFVCLKSVAKVSQWRDRRFFSFFFPKQRERVWTESPSRGRSGVLARWGNACAFVWERVTSSLWHCVLPWRRRWVGGGIGGTDRGAWEWDECVIDFMLLCKCNYCHARDGFGCECSSTVWTTRKSAAHLRESCPFLEGVGSGRGAPIYSWLLVGGRGCLLLKCVFVFFPRVSFSWRFMLHLWGFQPWLWSFCPAVDILAP